MADNQDFDLYKSLWTNINNVCAPPPPPGAPAKACFLMEMPGFTVDPNAFNPKSFNPSTMVSPECATAILCDRVPAFASYFYDTGERISSNYKLFMETFTIKSTREESTALKERYDEAIKMLYGDEQGYVMQKKTPLFLGLEKLHDKWEDAEKAREEFRTKCKDDKEEWPRNYERCAAPYVETSKEAYTEYDNLKQQIEKFEAAIHAYGAGDLNTLMQQQATGECVYRIAPGKRSFPWNRPSYDFDSSAALCGTGNPAQIFLSLMILTASQYATVHAWWYTGTRWE